MTQTLAGNALLAANNRLPWWASGTFLEIRPDAFYEAKRPGPGENYIGTGNFKGITEKMPFLAQCHIKAIWMTPFLEDDGTDGGYGITNFRKIDPKYGTLEDLKELVRTAHHYGIKVLMDWVPCHTSKLHPWFQQSRQHPRGKYGDWYIWDPKGEGNVLFPGPDGRLHKVRSILPNAENKRMVLVRVNGRWMRVPAECWAFDDVRRQWYWHRFKHTQPALNYANPEVEAENLSNMLYWLEEVGIDGFRVDAVPFLIFKPGTSHEDVDEVHDWVRRTREAIKARFPDALLLCESDLPEEQMRGYQDGDQFDAWFGFRERVAMDLVFALRDASPLVDLLLNRPQVLFGLLTLLMASNHDDHRAQWAQWKLTPTEILEILRKFYGDGVRGEPFANDAVVGNMAQMLLWNRRLIRLFNLIRMILPGALIDYYADLIGMGHHPLLARGGGPTGDRREGVRTPMQWTPGLNAGFSQASPNDLYLPVINTIDLDVLEKRGDYRVLNVEAALADPGSILHETIKRNELLSRTPLLALGHAQPLLGLGLPGPREDGAIPQFGVARYLDGHNKAIIGAFNLPEDDAPFSSELPRELARFRNSKIRTLSGGRVVGQLNKMRLDIFLPGEGGALFEIGYDD
jgi:maltose alpha-D-glucosyltransferase/alpha-amylase